MNNSNNYLLNCLLQLRNKSEHLGNRNNKHIFYSFFSNANNLLQHKECNLLSHLQQVSNFKLYSLNCQLRHKNRSVHFHHLNSKLISYKFINNRLCLHNVHELQEPLQHLHLQMINYNNFLPNFQPPIKNRYEHSQPHSNKHICFKSGISSTQNNPHRVPIHHHSRLSCLQTTNCSKFSLNYLHKHKSRSEHFRPNSNNRIWHKYGSSSIHPMKHLHRADHQPYNRGLHRLFKLLSSNNNNKNRFNRPPMNSCKRFSHNYHNQHKIK